MPFLLKGESVQMLCGTCNRVWTATLTKFYRRASTFNQSNKLECPWCKTVDSVLWDGQHKERITNSFAFPPRAPSPRKAR